MPPRELSKLLVAARIRLLKMHYHAGVGHIGGNLSCLDLLIFLMNQTIHDEDSFILSKGHSAGALYIALWTAGKIDEHELNTFHRDGTRLAGHPCAGWHHDIPFGTGSLGHGLSLAAGMAHARLLSGRLGTVYCLLSDGELNEGSTWEAIHYAGHFNLENLVVIVDRNGLQGFGATKDVMRLGGLASRFQDQGFAVHEIDGHSISDLTKVFHRPPSRLTAIFANTVKGKGVSFMENKMEWHYLPLTEDLYAQAVMEVESGIISQVRGQLSEEAPNA